VGCYNKGKITKGRSSTTDYWDSYGGIIGRNIADAANVYSNFWVVADGTDPNVSVLCPTLVVSTFNNGIAANNFTAPLDATTWPGSTGMEAGWTKAPAEYSVWTNSWWTIPAFSDTAPSYPTLKNIDK